MGSKEDKDNDKKIVDWLITSAGHIRKEPPLTLKELEGYLGLQPKQLTEKFRSKKKYLTCDVLLKLINTLYTYGEGSFQRKLASTVEDIYVEMAFQTLPKEIRESMVKSMSRWNLNNFISGAADIIWLPSVDSNFHEHLSQLFSPNIRHPMVKVLVESQSISKAIESIGWWAYGPSGNYKNQLSLMVYTHHEVNVIETMGCTMDDNFYVFEQDSTEGTFRLMNGFAAAKHRQQQLELSDKRLVWQLPRIADARKIERFVRSVPEDWSPAIVEFLRSKIIKIEEADRVDTLDGQHDIFTEVKEEIIEALGEDLGRKFWNRLVMYLQSLESEYFK